MTGDEGERVLLVRELERVAREVDEHLSHYFSGDADEGALGRLRESMKYACDGGKRVRAFLVSEGVRFSRADGEGVAEGRLDVMMAVEMLHAYSLVHDDLPMMDDDDWRRHRPTVHKAYDEATAILCGDGLLTLAFEVLSGVSLPDSRARALVSVMARSCGYRGMVGGQAMDVGGEIGDVETLRRMQRLKTGELMACSLESGGIVGGVSLEGCKELRAVGLCLGEIFQVVDDILDVEGEDEETGKGKGRDEGKVTCYDFMESPREELRQKREDLAGLVVGWSEESRERILGFADILIMRRG
jgi:farnesyl diphosphate synthase